MALLHAFVSACCNRDGIKILTACEGGGYALHLPWEHSGSVTDLSQGAAAKLLRVVGDRWQPGCLEA